MDRHVKLHGDIAMLFLAVFVGLAGCVRSPARAGTSDMGPAHPGAARNEPMGARPQARALPTSGPKPRMLGVIARLPADTIRLSPEEPPREPTARYATLDAAC